MLFNSLEFLIFIGVFFAAWPFLRKAKTSRWIYLTAASFFFYGWWDWRFLFLIIASGLIDFFAGLAIQRHPAQKKIFLAASIVGNLGSLALFKYLDFFIRNANGALDLFGSSASIPMAHLALPIGISFYTFQSMSYTIDVYRGQLAPTRNLFHFFAYLSMFPQLVAGPIVRAAHLLPQLETTPSTTEEQRWEGIGLILYGFFKKAVVADSLAPVVNAAFAMETPLVSCAYWWIVMVMFSFQIYCDFSGYSDIARGLGKWMGYDFPVNFDHPYISASVREFWTRWHISLSTWFRDYVYIPLGGSRNGPFAAHRNMWCAMLLSGLWHGAAWTFVAWAALHALYLSVERLTHWPRKIGALPGGRPACVLIVFFLALIGWVFFRAQSFSQAGVILLRLFDFGQMDFSLAVALVRIKALLLVSFMIARQAWAYWGLHEWSLWDEAPLCRVARPIALGLLLAACVFYRGPGAAFIYFQF